jgi:hypothetical protein
MSRDDALSVLDMERKMALHVVLRDDDVVIDKQQ